MLEDIRTIINLILSNKNKPLIPEISVSTRLREDLGFDSLDLAEFTVRIEEQYSIDIFEDGLIETISGVLKKLEFRP